MGRSRRVFVAAVIAATAGGMAIISPAGATTTVVQTFSTAGWFGFNEGTTGSVGNAALVTGPGTPSNGVGSAQLTVDSTGRASLATNAYAGTPLSAISALSYATYANSASLSHQANLQFDVDYDITDASTAYQGRLSFGRSTPVPVNTWTTVNALTDGEWFASGAPGNTVCTQANECTWSEVLTAFPNAGIRNDSVGKGALLFRLGGPVAGGASTYVDGLSITRPSGTSFVDFEPGAFITPSIAPPGSAVTVQAAGFKVGKFVVVKYDRLQSGVKGVKRRAILCKIKANAAGTITCSTAIPSVAGPVGVHSVTVRGPKAGGGVLLYTLDFVRSF
jgi:hypothetical protein